MSTALANFAASNFLTDFQAVNLLYKKYLGLPNAYPTAGAAQDVTTISSRPKVFANLQVFSQSVPATAPSDMVLDASWNSANSSIGVSFAPTRAYSSANPYIVKYTNIPLKAVQVNVSFEADISGLKDASGTLYSTYSTKPRFLSQAIPGNFDPAGSYGVTVTNKNNSDSIAQFNNQYPWILDGDAGFLTFYGSPQNGQPPLQFYNVSPTITLWRYEGIIGIGSTTSVAPPSGTNITVEDPSAGRFVITKDASGNLKALSDITYNNGILDISGLLSIKNITLDVSGSSEYKLTFPSNLPPTGQINYLASDASGNMIWRNNVTQAAAYIHPEGGFFLKDAAGSTIIVSDGSMEVDVGLQRIDNWLYNYIVSAPPQILDLSQSAATTTYVEFSWSYPLQLNVGIADQYLPRIDSLSAQYKTNTGTSFISIIDQNTAVIAPKITKMRLYKGSGSDGIVGDTFYKYNITTLSSPQQNSLKIWYNNKNLTPIIRDLSFNGYATAQPPNAPTLTSVTTTTPASALNLILNITSPTQADAGDPTNPSVSIHSYEIDVSNNGVTTTYTYTPSSAPQTQTSRQFSVTLTNGSTVATNGTLSPELSVEPLITYEVRIRAINTSTSTPSPNSNPIRSVTTGVVSASAYSLPALSLPSSYYTNSASYKNSSGTTFTDRIYRNGAGAQSATPIVNIPIHVTSNAASTASNIMQLETFIKEGTGNDLSGGSLSFNGFPRDNTGKDASLNDVRIETSGENTDPSNPTLYKRVTSTTVSITNNDTTNNIAMKASNQLKTLSLKYTYEGGNQTSQATYRVDDIAVAPVAGNGRLQLASGSNVYKTITGLNVLDTGSAKSIQILCDISNIASYYVADHYLSYSSSLASGTDSAVSNLSGTITNGKYSTVTNYTSGSIPLNIVNNTFVNGDLTASITPRNIYENAASPHTSVPLYTLIDHASIRFINNATSYYPSSLPSLNTSSYISGLHVVFPGFSTGKLSHPPSPNVYNHTAWDQYDALITGGVFKAAGSSAYLDFSNTRNGNGTAASETANANLSTVTTDHNWVVFAWNIAQTSTGYNSIDYQYVGGTPAKTYYCITDNSPIYWMDPTLAPSSTGFSSFATNSDNNMSTVSGGKLTDDRFAVLASTASTGAARLFVAIQLNAGSTIQSVQVKGVAA